MLAYSPLAFGVLAAPGHQSRANTVLRRRVEARLLPASAGLRSELQRLAKGRGVLTQVALNWCRAQDNTDSGLANTVTGPGCRCCTDLATQP